MKISEINQNTGTITANVCAKFDNNLSHFQPVIRRATGDSRRALRQETIVPPDPMDTDVIIMSDCPLKISMN